MRVLITAGATRNKVDAIRYLSANATGTTGVDLACQIYEQGHIGDTATRKIFMLGSAEACLRLKLATKDVRWTVALVEEFFGTRDLMERMRLNVPMADVIIHSAAVGDYEMAQGVPGKIPSGTPEISLKLTPTPKILDQIRGWNPTCFLVSFKAAPPETSPEDLVKIARAQLERTGSNLVFANVIGATEEVALVARDSHTRYPREAAIKAVAEAVKAHRCEVQWPLTTG